MLRLKNLLKLTEFMYRHFVMFDDDIFRFVNKFIR